MYIYSDYINYTSLNLTASLKGSAERVINTRWVVTLIVDRVEI